MKLTTRDIPFQAELRAAVDGKRLFSGYAAVFNQEASIMGLFREVVLPGAFRKTLADGPDVRMLINHEGVPLARSRGGEGTLRLSEDDTGLHVEAELDESNPRVQELSSAMDRGDLDQMSFAFRVIEDRMADEDDDVRIPLRELVEISLRNGDVSPVTYPAYEGTSAKLRAEARMVLAEHGMFPPLTDDEIGLDDALAAIARSAATSADWDGDPTKVEVAIEALRKHLARMKPPTSSEAGHSVPLDIAARKVALAKTRLRLRVA